jgi:hypothetical protein
MSTAKQQRLLDYNQIIVNNMSQFTSGSVLSRKKFVKLFNLKDIKNKGSYAKVHRSNLRLLKAQVEINQLMRESGLYIQSRDYYTSFQVLEKDSTKKAILRYSAEVDTNTACTNRLEDTMKSRVQSKTWGIYSNVSTQTIETMKDKPKTLRHKRKIQRVSIL